MAKPPGFYGATASAAAGSFPESAPAAPNLPASANVKKARTNFPSPQVHKSSLMVMPHKVNGAS